MQKKFTSKFNTTLLMNAEKIYTTVSNFFCFCSPPLSCESGTDAGAGTSCGGSASVVIVCSSPTSITHTTASLTRKTDAATPMELVKN